ncbi:MAG TPA: bifunctional DNA primase/polymerase [Pyrinomonadaceae bacterium]|jgi:hypothetical protein
MSNFLNIARDYLQRGYQPLPVPFRSKNPNFSDWQKLKTVEAELPKYFNGIPQNIGILLGEPSGNLVDIDLDTPESVIAARYYLPNTDAKFGRAGKLNSHYLYYCRITTKKFQDPLKLSSKEKTERKKAMIIEIRSTGSQTIFPGSTHPCGEEIEWTDGIFGQPAEVSAEVLFKASALTASAALIARYWYEGIRNDLSMALSGALLRNGFSEKETILFIKSVCAAANDEETESRLKTVRATAEKFSNGGKVTGLPTLSELLDDKPINKICEWLNLNFQKANSCILEGIASNQTAEEQKQRKTQASVLMNLSDDLEVFRTPNEECFAIVPVNNHLENLPINKKAFQSWLSRKYYETEKQTPNAQSVQDVITALLGKALYEGECSETHVRVAEHTGTVYVDLCNDKWQVVKITPNGWQIVESKDVPVKFRRTRGMLPLPLPQRGGSLEALQTFINVEKEDFVLFKAWLITTLRPNKPFPALALFGEQGSAKSTTQRVARSLIDPNQTPLRSRPRDERDLMIAANNSWIIALDNLSGISPDLSDSLCRLATGGGFSTRELFSNDDEILFNSMRPIMINGIEELTTRPDLLERSLVLNAPRITDDKRKTEEEFWREFEAAKPKIIGALFDKVSEALRKLPTVKLASKPRMADFAEFAFAAFGQEFLNRYEKSRAAANESALEASPVALAVQKFMETREMWSGIASDLLSEFEKIIDEKECNRKEFPKSPNALSGKLKRVAPNLRVVGINYEPVSNGGRAGRTFKLTKTNSQKDQTNIIETQYSEKNCKTSFQIVPSFQANENGNKNGTINESIIVPDEKGIVSENSGTMQNDIGNDKKIMIVPEDSSKNGQWNDGTIWNDVLQPNSEKLEEISNKSCFSCEKPVLTYSEKCPHCGDSSAPF